MSERLKSRLSKTNITFIFLTKQLLVPQLIGPKRLYILKNGCADETEEIFTDRLQTFYEIARFTELLGTRQHRDVGR